MKKIYIHAKDESFLRWLKLFLIDYFTSNWYGICSDPSEDWCDSIITFWFEGLEEITADNNHAKCIILDFHMLWWIEWKKDIVRLINDGNVMIFSCFPMFSYLYERYWIDNKKVKFINFAVDTSYTDKYLNLPESKNNNKDDYILVPWNHKRDYDLLFEAIVYLEKKWVFQKYMIIDWSLKDDYIGQLQTKYMIKSTIISSNVHLKYDEFLKVVQKSAFVIMLLKNERHICNWLTVFALSMCLRKLLVTNFNITTAPFVKNLDNCLCWQSNPEKIGDLILLWLNNAKLARKISDNAYSYAKENFSFEKLISEIIKEL